MAYLIYLGNFNAPVLFLGLVCRSVVVSGTVVINQFSVPLSYTSLNRKQKTENKYQPFLVSLSEIRSSVLMF